MMNKISINFSNQIITGNPKILVSSRHNQNWKQIECINGSQQVTLDLGLAAYDTLMIKLINREHNFDSDLQTTVEICDLSIDNINLQHLILQGRMYPTYDLNFVKKFDPPEKYIPGTIFHMNGTFEIDIKLPIYKFIVDSYEQNIS